MAKNTGRGSRIGSVAGQSQKSGEPTTAGSGPWATRNATSGRFVESKTSGGTFKAAAPQR